MSDNKQKQAEYAFKQAFVKHLQKLEGERGKTIKTIKGFTNKQKVSDILSFIDRVEDQMTTLREQYVKEAIVENTMFRNFQEYGAIIGYLEEIKRSLEKKGPDAIFAQTEATFDRYKDAIYDLVLVHNNLKFYGTELDTTKQQEEAERDHAQRTQDGNDRKRREEAEAAQAKAVEARRVESLKQQRVSNIINEIVAGNVPAPAIGKAVAVPFFGGAPSYADAGISGSGHHLFERLDDGTVILRNRSGRNQQVVDLEVLFTDQRMVSPDKETWDCAEGAVAGHLAVRGRKVTRFLTVQRVGPGARDYIYKPLCQNCCQRFAEP